MKSIDFLRELSIRGALLYNMLGHMASPCIPLIFATSERIANQYDKLKPKALKKSHFQGYHFMRQKRKLKQEKVRGENCHLGSQ